MKNYLELLNQILKTGVDKDDRTGTGTISLFGPQLEYDLNEGFPAVTTKKLFFKSVKVELAWFLRGDTSLDYLHEHGVSIWDEWADESGDLGPVYGFQWRNFGSSYHGPQGSEKVFKAEYPQESEVVEQNMRVNYTDKGVDQLAEVADNLRHNPFSRRHIVSAWNPVQIDEMALPPCHLMFQFNVRPMTEKQRLREFYDRRGMVPDHNYSSDLEKLDEMGFPSLWLDCKMYQRSADVFLGVPFNIASYSLLTHIMARDVNMLPGKYIHSFGDVHIYKNHFEQVQEQLTRTPYILPDLSLSDECKGIDSFEPSHAELEGYEHHAAIRAPISV